jgi:general secretion pathway protein G
MSNKRQQGFTIVELLIVIVVIAILAAITIVAYNGIQAQAKDSERTSDARQFAQVIEAYYIDNGFYPPFNNGTIGVALSSWRTANLPSMKDGLMIPPGATAITLVNNKTPTVGEYGYHNDGSCTGTGASARCTEFGFYWRSDVDGLVKTQLSLHGQ